MDALVTDALRLLGHLPEQELGEKAANAVGILALVAGQDVELAEDSDGRDGRWRITQGTAPGRMISTAEKNDTWLHTRAAALNLRQLINPGLTHTDGTWHLAATT